MTFRSWLLLLTLLSFTLESSALANASNQDCPQPALSRLVRHKVAPGETLESIAQRYNLIPATLIGMNPTLRNSQVAVGREILIPPYNGIRVEVPRGRTWRQVAATYKVRPEVLFEVNGCQKEPRVVFVPGVNWSQNRPATLTAIATPPPPPLPIKLAGYPLPNVTSVGLPYGWQINPATGQVFFHSGLDLLAATGTSVQAIGAGEVVFAGEQGSYGNLVVINHGGGLQSRYAHLSEMTVVVGQTVKQGDLVGTVGTTGKPTSTQPHLHFEVRSSSSLGWVAEDPNRYLKQ